MLWTLSMRCSASFDGWPLVIAHMIDARRLEADDLAAATYCSAGKYECLVGQ